ncbi:3-hydroxyacyl-CoA dehydrogenase NAD-binding domain-containing protein [Rathayibacter toxicus]|uniref:3-hydroxyacyl-CoA dehydrogenase n=1 Tax=Rathayibacter toxicus TaxID=145458 RepID=A0A0C5BHE3_9MICO|nr:3-hydroxyacyl-CoA dehydrogenase NAD-binding domain-containing protein [Rathayibacter toxicus]AJM77655.1 3-hydroxyacyl-CoA dehydrogenase [Rathayibacter toxicus]ALS56405.1 3-hydroxyacyl-CoA dehydrogenase [Rathayibacter toxicus]KKM44514.1 3-hydroxyacyl-CoA dehydrogenase [Rathayibacter toxicus]PPG21777.1 3-hydroxyacyl-CoA dehydrogenase [Rathayibacter toxicus]PPG46739.1 3-hydroxyacyl-CoA dehydrogenase [Rathayibacter toxicus]
MLDGFEDLLDLAENEVVTHSYLRDIPLPSGRVLALITLDNDRNHTRPNTFGPASLIELADVLATQRERAERGDIQALGITGKPFILAAGADLSKVGQIPHRELGRQLARLGHRTLGMLSELTVPSFAFINGLALGGGTELALHAHYRTVDSSISALGLPEVFLGIIPGWGGTWLLPNLIGIENALRVVVENPLKNNRTLRAQEVLTLGIADALFPSATFLEDSLRWADGVLGGEVTVTRKHTPGILERLVKWDAAIAVARKQLESKIGTVPASPYRALELLKAAKKSNRQEGFAAEDEALADLLAGDQFRASIYAFDLVQKRVKRPAGAPETALAKPVTKVGVIGAGVMATQLALLFVRRLQVPVVITDLDQKRVDKGVSAVVAQIDLLLSAGRLSQDDANRLRTLVTGTTDRSDFSDCDWVIEAVFEELTVKQEVFADIERFLMPTAVLATNTSSLSVERIGERLEHPERLVGFHFFNPVAMMPLIEVVRTPRTDDATLSTAMVTAKALKKNAVITRDTPGFVVNRILAKLLGEVMHAVDTGTPIDVVEQSLAPFGLPMTPFELLELVGLTVGAHVLDTHHAAFPDRFYCSDTLHRLAELGQVFQRDVQGRVTGIDKRAAAIVAGGSEPMTRDELRVRIETGLADEVKRMLDDKVVHAAEDIDLCLILGAGYPFHMGGLTPYLDRVGASERAVGDTFHHPAIRGVS